MPARASIEFELHRAVVGARIEGRTLTVDEFQTVDPTGKFWNEIEEAISAPSDGEARRRVLNITSLIAGELAEQSIRALGPTQRTVRTEPTRDQIFNAMLGDREP